MEKPANSPELKKASHALEKSAHASEYLANERTFLAWIRTSIAAISFGLVIAKFSIWLTQLSSNSAAKAYHTGLSLVIGVVMIAIGAVLALLSVYRYRAINKQIAAGQVQPDTGLVFVVTGLVIILSIVLIAYLLVTSGYASIAPVGVIPMPL